MNEKLSRILSKYAGPVFVLWIVFLFIRLYEIVSLALGSSSEQDLFVYGLRGSLYDTLTVIFISGFLLLPYLLLAYLHQKAAALFLLSCHFICVLANIVLVRTFLLQQIPVDQVIFTYSFTDILMAGKSSSGGNSWLLLPICLVLFLFILLHLRNRERNFSNRFLLIFCSVSLVMLPLSGTLYYQRHEGQLRNFVINNKLAYFVYSSLHYYTEKKAGASGIDLPKEREAYWSNNPQWKFTSKEYPLLHEENSPDVLGPLFNLGESPPNFVFIIVEGLSRSLVGNDARLGNFTPFLDSLSKQSLYWPNFLSTAERTFNVLPSSLGSLPYARNGFMEMGFKRRLPLHYSLVSLLKENSYDSRFYVGGWPHFNNMDGFLNEQGIGYIVDERWRSAYKKIAKDESGYTWGYPDDVVFKRSLEELHTGSFRSPRLDIFLTVSSHAPFYTPDDARYQALFEKRMQQLGLDESRKKQYGRNKEKFSAILYVDESIRNFIDAYRKEKDFANTIFIIFGDHALPELHGDQPIIEKYHIPLIIYSPLLKSSKRMEAVSSHLDLTPSLLAMLKNKYPMDFPEEVHWLGTGMDTATAFRNHHSLAFMHNNKNMKDYMDGNYFLSYDDLFLIKPGLELEPANDEAAKKKVKAKLENFIALSTTLPYMDKLLPKESFAKQVKAIHPLSSVFIKEVETRNPLKKEISPLDTAFKIPGEAKNLLVENNFEYYTTDTLFYTQPVIFLELRTAEGKVVRSQKLEFTRVDNGPMLPKMWNKVTCGSPISIPKPAAGNFYLAMKIVNRWERPSFYRNWKFDIKEVK